MANAYDRKLLLQEWISEEWNGGMEDFEAKAGELSLHVSEEYAEVTDLREDPPRGMGQLEEWARLKFFRVLDEEAQDEAE